MREEVLDGLSIGYNVLQDSTDEDGVRHLKEIQLWEISICNFQACPGAVVTGVKSLDRLSAFIMSLKNEKLNPIQQKVVLQNIETLKALLTEEPPVIGTPPAQEPPLDSDLIGIFGEAVKEFGEFLRSSISIGASK
jgi:hypothetical protein